MIDRAISSSRSGGDDATIAFSMSDEHDPVVTVSVLKSELATLRSELKSELTSELTSEFRSELLGEVTGLKAEITKLERRISEEGGATRAHFDIMVEKMDDTVRLVAEVAAHHGIVLDNHEARLQKIEKR